MISLLLGLSFLFGNDKMKLCIRVIAWRRWNKSRREKVFLQLRSSYSKIPISVCLACRLWTLPSDMANLIKIEQTNSLEDESQFFISFFSLLRDIETNWNWVLGEYTLEGRGLSPALIRTHLLLIKENGRGRKLKLPLNWHRQEFERRLSLCVLLIWQLVFLTVRVQLW